MSRRIKRADYEQVLLLPPSLEDWVGAGHPVRFIREVVESLKLGELEFEEPNSEEGGECYAPQLLLSVWLYGYWRRIRSSRKLETACREEMAFIWLSGNTQPDHNTLWRFWAKNQAGIKNLFKRSVQMAMEMGEVDMALAAIDGTKIQALCSGSGLHSRQHNEKLFKKLESQIQELEQQIAQSADDQQQLERRPVLSEALRDKKRLAQRVREALRRSEQNGQGYVHPQEPDAQRMPMNSGLNRFGYNAQTAVDAKSQIIVASEVVNSPNDKHQLLPMLEAIKTTTGQAPAQTVADAGYSSAAQLQKAAQEGLEVYTQLITQSKAAVEAYHTRHFRYNRSTDCVECPQGQSLKLHQVRNKNGVLIKVYRNRAACAQCLVRSLCTRDRGGRSIDIYPWHQFMEQYRDKMSTAQSQALLKRRSIINEPVFAWLKEHAQFRRFTFGGLSKAAVQWAFICAIHNFKILAKAAKNAPQGPDPLLPNKTKQPILASLKGLLRLLTKFAHILDVFLRAPIFSSPSTAQF